VGQSDTLKTQVECQRDQGSAWRLILKAVQISDVEFTFDFGAVLCAIHEESTPLPQNKLRHQSLGHSPRREPVGTAQRTLPYFDLCARR
jgi:hypothetical protein